MNENGIGIVLVTYNRLQLLKKTLICYENQTYLPQYILVVNNNSSDGTKEWLEEWVSAPGKTIRKVLHLSKNTGGSGGFYAGLVEAIKFNSEWIWVADDDAFPEPQALSELINFQKNNRGLVDNAVALCSVIYDENRNFVLGHRCRLKYTPLGASESPVKLSEYNKEYFSVDFFSFVGSAIRTSAIKKVGFPKKEYFIYHDDYEYALRIGKKGSIICVTSSKVQHPGNTPISRDVSWRDYYSTRNVLLMNKEHLGKFSYYGRAIRRMLTAIKSGNLLKIKVFYQAIRDAHNNKTGIHPIYKPGWNPKK